MNTTSNTATGKILMNEQKTLDTFGIISQLVETSSSTTTTLESTTAQISSKSSSPFNAVTYKESKLSPLSETTISPPNLATSTYTNTALISPISPPNSGNLPDSPILPFLAETFKQEDGDSAQQPKNMLACGSGSSNSSQQSATGGSTPIPTTAASSPTNSIKNMKGETYTAPSPCNENTNSQHLSEENSNNNGNNTNNASNNSITMDNVLREREGGTTTSSIIRQNSNSSLNSCSATVNASSPNNASDHSNSSNISSNLSQAADSNADILQELNNEKAATSGKVNIGPASVKEEDNVNAILSEKSNSSTSSAQNASCTTPTLSTLATIKEEPTVLSGLVSVKKEENTMSPVMSPVGFGSIGSVPVGSVEAVVREETPVKLNELSSNTAPNSIGNNNNNEIMGSSGGCAEDDSPVIPNNPPNDPCGGGGNTQHPATAPFSNNNTNSSFGSCMDYMQQQNHIFVFSTQLANKGAESVLNGQFPTIIAYHCTQPATKSFLEDFFMKNPLKMTKLQRQNSLNFCGIGGAGQQWMGGCNSMPKMQQKSNNKMNCTSLNSNIDSKPHGQTFRGGSMPGFSDGTDALTNENDLMCWEQTRSLEGATPEAHAMKILDSVDSVVNAQNVGVNKSIGSVDPGDSSIPSLQGVKVPDENLTPQQRQHREEQLAKIKKMNQFLFPENGNDFRSETGNNQMGKLSADGVPPNIAGLMMNMPNSQLGNTLNPSMRNMPANVMNQNKGAICSSESMNSAIEDSLVPSEIMGAHDIGGLQCNANKGACGNAMAINNQPSMACGPGVMGGMGPNASMGSLSGNSMAVHGGNINGPNGLMPNSPEVLVGFNQGCNSGDNPSKGMVGGMHSQDLNQVGMAQMEWSKLQHQFFEERIKGNKPPDMPGMPPAMCRSNSTGVGVALRPNLGGPCVSSAATGTSQTGRSGQGPPPPYHPTQRSASVPIATQSPNPSSPNNPTSNLSLPSPRTTGNLGITGNSPNMDMLVSTMAPTTSSISIITTTTATISTSLSNTQSKNTYQQEGSPTSNNGSTNRSRNNMNQFNSNPSTPLSHMSPKDLDSFSATTPTGDLKNARPSPQRSKTPLIGPVETANIEGRFPPASPGLNFPPHIQNPSSGAVNSYKPPGALERQNSAPVPSQFCRRTDNLPLNPNSARPPQNKLNTLFDPISSLAQMCNSPGGIGVIGGNDMNMPSNVNQNMEGMMPSMDSGMDHCNPVSSGNMNMPPHMGGNVPFMSNNCHLNPMLGPMGQRLLNPKMCSGFNGGNGNMREGPGNFHNVLPPSHRIPMNRMNFGNFNVSPNIQVKASTPNTIQYMPVRPQNNNNNMRVQPSLEFLQRYANPQMSGGGGVMDGGHMNQMNAGNPADANKMVNNPNNVRGGNSPMNFFQNCNQMGGMGVAEAEDMAAGLMTGHDMNIGSSMIRGMRPMRQHNMAHGGGNSGVPGPRMQAPGGNIGGPGVPQFSGNPHDAMDCNEPTGMFGGGGGGSGPGQMYGGNQQKQMKPMGGICQGMNTGNGGNNPQLPNAGLLQNEQMNSAMQSSINGPVILGPNNMMPNTMAVGNNAPSGACGGGNAGVNYKSYAGPASNDLKYAQQYHSFQQQLYATSTRSHQSGGATGLGNNPSNPAFFVNK